MPTKDAEMMAEQQYFDEAYEAYQASFLLDGSEGLAGDRATGKALDEHFKSRPKLKSDQAVALGKLTHETGINQYVGYIPIRDSAGDLLVISWKSKAGEKFYEASSVDPKGVARRRTFRTKSNSILDFDDAYLIQTEGDGDEHALSQEGVTDELLDVLRANRSATMSDIVKTIQGAQFSIIREELEQLLVVQGGPGTGKTAVALHRVAWLIFNYRDVLKPSDVLIVGPNDTFTSYIATVLPVLGEERIQHTSLTAIVSEREREGGVDSLLTARIKGNSGMRTVLRQGLEARIQRPTDDVTIQRANSSAQAVVPAAVVGSLIDKSRNLPYRNGRAQFKRALMVEAAKLLSARGATNAEQLVDSASLENQVNRLWPALSAGAFLRELLGSRRRLATAAHGALTKDELDALYRAPAQKVSVEPWSQADLFLLDELNDLMGEPSPRRYKHIVVDEAQDLTGMQMLALKRRSTSGSMTLVGDLAQSTGAAARESWSDVTALLYQTASPKLCELEVGYRVPREIYEVAQQLLVEAAPGLTPPQIVRDAHESPRVHIAERVHLPRCVVKVAQEHARKGRFVGIIADRAIWPELKDEFAREEMAFADTDEGSLGRTINLVAPESAKGLEFDAVIVVDPQEMYRGEHGARLLYIALTRSTSRLDLIGADFDLPSIIQPGLPDAIIFESESTVATGQGKPSQAGDTELPGTESAPRETATPDQDGDTPTPTAGTGAVEEAPAGNSPEPAPGPAGGTEPDTGRTGGFENLRPRQRKIAEDYVRELLEDLGDSFQPELARTILEEALRRLS